MMRQALVGRRILSVNHLIDSEDFGLSNCNQGALTTRKIRGNVSLLRSSDPKPAKRNCSSFARRNYYYFQVFLHPLEYLVLRSFGLILFGPRD